MNRNFYDILIAKLLRIPILNEYLLTLEVVELDSQSQGAITVGGSSTEYKKYTIKVKDKHSWSSVALTKNASTVFVGWFFDKAATNSFNPNANIAASINKSSVTLYAVFRSNITKKRFCYSANSPTDVCNICTPVDVYFNTVELNSLGYTGSKWYATSSLNTPVSDGYYLEAGITNNSAPIYLVRSSGSLATQSVTVFGTCGGSGGPGGTSGVRSCQNPAISVQYNLTQNSLLNANVIDVISQSTTHSGTGTSGSSYSFSIKFTAYSGYSFASVSDIVISSAGFTKSNAYLSNNNTVLNFDIVQAVYPSISTSYNISFSGVGAASNPVTGPTECYTYIASTYSSFPITISYIDCNGLDNVTSVGGIGGYDEQTFCARQIVYNGGANLIQTGLCAGTEPTVCECYNSITVNTSSPGTFSYIDCNGTSIIIDLPFGNYTISDCIQNNSWGGSAVYSVIAKGICCTPTINTNRCTTYQITNTSFVNSISYNWIDCDNNLNNSILGAGQSATLCAFFEGDISISDGTYTIENIGPCSSQIAPEPESNSTPAIGLGNAICRVNGTCNDNSSCTIRYGVSTSNAPIGSYVEMTTSYSNNATVSLVSDEGQYYVHYTETSGNSYAYINLFLKNSEGNTIASSSFIYVYHSSFWSFLPLCSGETNPVVYDAMYVESSDGTSAGYVQFNSDWVGYSSPISTTINPSKCYYIISTTTLNTQPVNTITGTCVIEEPNPGLYSIQITYDTTSALVACDNWTIYNGEMLIYSDNNTLISSTFLYDNMYGTLAADAGWYSDGYNARYWNGSSFTSDAECSGRMGLQPL